MITIVKVNVITDDEGMPEYLRAEFEAVLQNAVREDPEGAAHANVQLEWKHTVMPRAYMSTLAGRSSMQIRVQSAPVKAPTRKPRKK